jgi:hypothetical protein
VISPRPFPSPLPDPTDEPEPASARQTIPPPFDPAAFAQSSERRLRAVTPVPGDPTTDEAPRPLDEAESEKNLSVLARLLEEAPLNADVGALSKGSCAALERECLSVIGSESAVLVVAVSPDELKRLGLDHVGGFLLSLMDGSTSVDTLLDICGLSRLLALRHLRDLVMRRIVKVQSTGD